MFTNIQNRVAVSALALAALLLAAMAPASAQLVVTGTENGGVPVSSPAFGSVSTLNSGIADSFGAQAATTAPYNFVDVFTFTYTGAGGGASGAAISFASFTDPNSAIGSLQAAVFSGSALTAGTHSGNVGDSPTTTGLNPVQGGAWANIALGTGSATIFYAPLTTGTTYQIEVRGLIGTAGGSYGGNLSITSVPELSSASLLLLGAGVLAVGGVGLRRRRA